MLSSDHGHDFTHHEVANMLTAAAATPVLCPNSTASQCRCPQHHPGIVTLHILTTRPAPDNLIPLPPINRCDGSMTCDCRNCEHDRVARARLARTNVRQPWEPIRRAA